MHCISASSVLRPHGVYYRYPCHVLRFKRRVLGMFLQASDCDNICTFFAVISVGGWGKCPFVTCSLCLSFSLVRNIVFGTVRGSGRWAASSTDISRAPPIRLPVPVPLPLKHFCWGPVLPGTFTLFLGAIGFNFMLGDSGRV